MFLLFYFSNGTGTNGKANDSQNPFDEEEEWDEGDGTDNVLVDNGEPGVPVKALYDYEGAESDELTFKMGKLLPPSVDDRCLATKILAFIY